MEKLNINQWAAEDRPREKMMQKGAEALSDAELLAILIGSGNTEETAVTLMQRRRILGTAYEPRRQSDRQGTHQPRRHRPDHRRRAQHPARSPAATRHTDSPYPQPSLRQPAPQQRRPAADGTREESRPNHEHTPDRPRHRHGRKPLQLQRRRITINNPSYGHTIRKTKAVITLTISTLYLPAIYQPM